MNQMQKPDLDDRVEYAQLEVNNSEGGYHFTADEFRRYLFMLGLVHCEAEVLPKLTGKPYIPFPLNKAIQGGKP